MLKQKRLKQNNVKIKYNISLANKDTKLEEDNLFYKLNELTKKILENQDTTLICITGKAGTGKSTLGKYFRKKGYGDFSKYQISVIDDGVMSLDLFYILNKRIKNRSKEKDELEPFLKHLPKRKKIIFYINQTPELRISKTDILIKVNIDEKTRETRLMKRDGKFKHQNTKKIALDYTYLLEIPMEKYADTIFINKGNH